MQNYNVVCLMPNKETYPVDGWSSFFSQGLLITHRRPFCYLTNAYTYDENKKMTSVPNWGNCLRNFELSIDNVFSFVYLKNLLSYATGSGGEKKIYVSSGSYQGLEQIGNCSYEETNIRYTGAKVKVIQGFHQSTCYASVSTQVNNLLGHDPEIRPSFHFRLSMFPDTNDLQNNISDWYDKWCEDNETFSGRFLPDSPSPVQESVEMLILDSERQFVVVFAGKQYHQPILEFLRSSQPPTFFARLEGVNVFDWIEQSGNPGDLIIDDHIPDAA